MPAIQRLNDSNDAGGAITVIAQSTVFVNNLQVSIDGSSGTTHAPCSIFAPQHCAGNWFTAGGASNVYINGVQVNYTTNTDTCGHVRVGGSPNVNVG